MKNILLIFSSVFFLIYFVLYIRINTQHKILNNLYYEKGKQAERLKWVRWNSEQTKLKGQRFFRTVNDNFDKLPKTQQVDSLLYLIKDWNHLYNFSEIVYQEP